MSTPSITVRAVFLVLAACVIPACNVAQRRADEYKVEFDPLVGKTRKADIANRYGPPLRKEIVEGSEFWMYHLSMGSSTRPVFLSGWQSHEKYDELFFTFDKEGVLRKYRVSIGR